MTGIPERLDFYHTRYTSRKKYLETAQAGSLIGIVMTLIFCLSDFASMKMLFNLVQTESIMLISLVTLAGTAILDIPAALLAVRYKEYRYGIGSKRDIKIALIGVLAAFSIVFIPLTIFRLRTADLTFSVGAGSTIVSMTGGGTAGTVSESGSKVTTIAAAFFAVMPLGTSVASFTVTLLAGGNPLEARMNKLKHYIITNEAHLAELEQYVTELENTGYCETMTKRENELYQNFVNECIILAIERETTVRRIFAESCGDPETVTLLTASSKGIAATLMHDLGVEVGIDACVSPHSGGEQPPAAAIPDVEDNDS